MAVCKGERLKPAGCALAQRGSSSPLLSVRIRQLFKLSEERGSIPCPVHQYPPVSSMAERLMLNQMAVRNDKTLTSNCGGSNPLIDIGGWGSIP